MTAITIKVISAIATYRNHHSCTYGALSNASKTAFFSEPTIISVKFGTAILTGGIGAGVTINL